MVSQGRLAEIGGWNKAIRRVRRGKSVGSLEMKWGGKLPQVGCCRAGDEVCRFELKELRRRGRSGYS